MNSEEAYQSALEKDIRKGVTIGLEATCIVLVKLYSAAKYISEKLLDGPDVVGEEYYRNRNDFQHGRVVRKDGLFL